MAKKTATWWKSSAVWNDLPQPVEVMKETTSQIVLAPQNDGMWKRGETRVNKRSTCDNYFPTYDEAADWKRRMLAERVSGATMRLEQAKKDAEQYEKQIKNHQPEQGRKGSE